MGPPGLRSTSAPATLPVSKVETGLSYEPNNGCGTENMALTSTSRSNLVPRRRRAAVAPRETRPPVEVSVCIVNWNCCEYLRACLRSLLERPQGVSLEVIVVDNASEDGAADMTAEEF